MKRSEASRFAHEIIPEMPRPPGEVGAPPPMPKPGRRTKPPPPPAPPPIFAQPARGFPPPPPMRDGFARIVAAIYEEDVDVVEEYRAIEQSLVVQGALSPGAVKAQAAKAEEMARRAYRLYLLARAEHEAYLRQSDACYGAVRDAARHRLEQDKASGARSKQVTDADVLAEAAMAFPDEWGDICERREKAKGMRDMIEKLAELAEKRVYSLSRLLEPGVGRV